MVSYYSVYLFNKSSFKLKVVIFGKDSHFLPRFAVAILSMSYTNGLKLLY